MLRGPTHELNPLVPLLNLHHVSLVGDARLYLLVLDLILNPTKQNDTLVRTAITHHADAGVADVVQALGRDRVLDLEPDLLVE